MFPSLFAENEAGPSRLPGVTRNTKYDPEFVTPVGIAHLQPLSLSEMPFVTDPYILENIPEIRYNRQSEEGPPPGFECVEEESEDDVIAAETAGNDQSTILHFYRTGDGTQGDQWRLARTDEEIQALLDKEKK